MAQEKFVSGETYQKMHRSGAQGSASNSFLRNKIAVIAAIVVLCGLSFAGGAAYQKHQAKPAAQLQGDSSNRGFPGGGQGMRRGGSIGQVTAVSDTSITVNDQRTSSSKTFTINSSTSITDNGQTVAASDIKTGDTVLVMASSSDSSTATRILVNPSFGGGFGGNADQSQPTQQ